MRMIINTSLPPDPVNGSRVRRKAPSDGADPHAMSSECPLQERPIRQALQVDYAQEAHVAPAHDARRAPDDCSQGLCAGRIDSRMFFRYR